jgi:hypothetical protein
MRLTDSSQLRARDALAERLLITLDIDATKRPCEVCMTRPLLSLLSILIALQLSACVAGESGPGRADGPPRIVLGDSGNGAEPGSVTPVPDSGIVATPDTGAPVTQDKGAAKDTAQGQVCGFSSTNATCNTCVVGTCGSACVACSSNSECVALFNCAKTCTTTTCVTQCQTQHASGNNAYLAFFGSSGCLKSKCSSACGSTTTDGGTKADTGSTTDPYAAARAACLNVINSYRAMVGAPALVRNTAKEPCADAQAKVDAQHNTAHYAYFNGPSCIVNNVTDRQNECPAWWGPPETTIQSCIQKMYAEGPGGGHYDVLTKASYKSVACGIYVVSSNNVWMVQNYY